MKSVQFALGISPVREIAKSVQFAVRISNVQLILRNHEISTVCSRDFPCSADFVKSRNQFSLLSEFPMLS